MTNERLKENDLLSALQRGSPTERVAAIRVLASSSLYLFARVILQKDYLRPHPHRAVCEFLESPSPQHRLLVLPRSFLKSTLNSLSLPLWMALQDPSLTILLVTNSDDNARKMLGELRTTIERNELLRALWPEVIPASASEAEKWSDSQVCLKRKVVSKEMTFEAAGVSTTMTGRHYRRIIVDDPVAAKRDDRTGEEAAPTKDDIDTAISFISKLRPYFTDPSETRVYHSGTRWAHYDPIAYLKGLQRADGTPLVATFEMAALDAEGRATYERYPVGVLDDIRAEVGPYLWASQYMNQPIAEVDHLFKKEWRRYWSRTPPNDSIAALPNLEDLWIAITLDPANRQHRHSDYTALVAVGSDGSGNWYVLDYVKKRMAPEDTVKEAVRMYERWNARVLGVECVAAQLTYKKWIDAYARDHNLYIKTLELKSKNIAEAKQRRIESIQPLCARGQLFLEQGRSAALEQEMDEYPNGRHDDLLDALAYHTQLARRPTARVAEKVVADWAKDPNGGPPLLTFEGMRRRLNQMIGRGRGREVAYVSRDFVV